MPKRIAQETLNLNLPVRIEAAEAEGKRPTFSMNAYTGGLMRLEGFSLPVVVDLKGARAHAADIPAYMGHDKDRLVGQGTPSISASGIGMDGTITGDNEHAQEVVSQAHNGFKWKTSIGGPVLKREYVAAGSKVRVNGRTFPGPIIVAREFVLSEISFVPSGADPNATASLAASSLKGIAEMNFENWLEANGWDGATLSEQQATTLRAAFDAEQADDAEPPKKKRKKASDPPADDDDLAAGTDDFFAEEKLEQARRQEIRAYAKTQVAKNPDNVEKVEAMMRLAIDGGWEPNQFKIKVLEAGLPQSGGRAGVSHADDGIDNVVLEAAVCMSLHMTDDLLVKRFKEEKLDAAHKHFPGGIGLKELLIRAASQNGFRGMSFGRNERAVLKYAFAERGELQASGGFSTIDVSSILSNIGNKRISDAWNHVDQTWRDISAIGTVTDFKTHTRHTLTGDLTYEKIGPAGEIKHGTLGETTYTNRAETYAKMLAITRTDMINDDLGAFDRVLTRLGRGGALKLNDVFWAAFVDDAAFFTTGNGNYDAGTDTALTAAGLAAAMVLVDAQTDPDGKIIGSDPVIMLVSALQWEPGAALMTSTRVNSGGAATTEKIPDGNIFAGKFKVVKSKYLSGLTWYLLRDPMDLPVIETVFLNGMQMPTVDSADADFDQLGIKMRGYHDFGCALQEPRGGYKFKGEA